MPIVARKFGKDFGKWMHRNDTELIYQTEEILQDLDKKLKEVIAFWIRKYLYPTSPAIKDIQLWLRYKGSLMEKLRTEAMFYYSKLGSLTAVYQKLGYFEGYNRVSGFFRELYPVKKVVKMVKNIGEGYKFENTQEQEEGITLYVGSGKVSDEFKKFLAKQFEQGSDPRTLIKTLSYEHVKDLERVMTQGVIAGQDLPLLRDQFVEKIFGSLDDAELLGQMRYNTLRTMRTSFQRASNATVSDYCAMNKSVVKELERVANGRPCIVCMMLDGTRYPVGSELNDHPNGMCVFAPVIYSLEEMGFGKDVVGKGGRAAWSAYGREYPLYSSEFFGLEDVEKAKVFGNRKLFDLWKAEQFPVQSLISKDGTVFSYKKAVEKVKDLGGINYPKAAGLTIDSEGISRVSAMDGNLNRLVDPLDRADENLLVFRDKPISFGINKFGLDRFELPVNKAKVPDRIWVEANALVKQYGKGLDGLKSSKWWDFNSYARKLGLALRKDIEGNFYYVMKNEGGIVKALKFDKVGEFVNIVSKAAAEVESILEKREVVSRTNLTGDMRGSNLNAKVKFKDTEVEACWKPVNGEVEGLRFGIDAGSYYKRERAAYVLDRELGFDCVPETVVRELNGVQGSLQNWVEGDVANNLSEEFLVDLAKKGKFDELGAFDFISGSSDRHEFNFLIDSKTKKVWGIDNGLTFGKNEYYNYKLSVELGRFGNLFISSHPMTFLVAAEREISKEVSGKVMKFLAKIELDEKYLDRLFGKLLSEEEKRGILIRAKLFVEYEGKTYKYFLEEIERKFNYDLVY